VDHGQKNNKRAKWSQAKTKKLVKTGAKPRESPVCVLENGTAM